MSHEAGHISFQCAWCKASLTVPNSLAGQGMLCPTCNARVQVPRIDDAENPYDEKPAGVGSGNTIRFHCPKCGKRLKATENQSGKLGKCSRCGAVVRILDQTSSDELASSLDLEPPRTPPPALPSSAPGSSFLAEAGEPAKAAIEHSRTSANSPLEPPTTWRPGVTPAAPAGTKLDGPSLGPPAEHLAEPVLGSPKALERLGSPPRRPVSFSQIGLVMGLGVSALLLVGLGVVGTLWATRLSSRDSQLPVGKVGTVLARHAVLVSGELFVTTKAGDVKKAAGLNVHFTPITPELREEMRATRTKAAKINAEYVERWEELAKKHPRVRIDPRFLGLDPQQLFDTFSPPEFSVKGNNQGELGAASTLH